MAEDLLFATLDPTMRAITLPGVEKAILSDTVGFISDLPTQLVAAFRATLEEVTAAEVICHVRDMANEAAGAQKTEVLSILEDLGVIEEGGVSRVPIVEIWNKWDAVAGEQKDELEALAGNDKTVAVVSALTGEGVDGLLDRLGSILTKSATTMDVILPAGDGRRIAWLHAHGEVIEECEEEGGDRRLTVRLNAKERGQFEQL